MIPAKLTDFKDWPKVEKFVKKRISMQYEDLRKLMQEPGFNLLAVAGLCDLVSGLSVSLYKPAVTKKSAVVCGIKKQVDLGTGELFTLLLETYYPWQKGERRKRKSAIIYKFVRNPLVHSLGMGKKSGRRIEAAKCKRDKDNHVVAWTDRELDVIERSDDLDNVPVALRRSGKKWRLIVDTSIWVSSSSCEDLQRIGPRCWTPKSASQGASSYGTNDLRPASP